MRDLRVTLVQTTLHWEQPDENRRMLEERLQPLAGITDLVVLPEMFTTGFSMEAARLAESMDGPTVAWMRQQAAALDAALYGSIIVREGDRTTNRGVFVQPDGAVEHYDKRHLFRMGGEHQHYAAGSRRVVVHWRGWRVLLQVCYDLRFPVFSRNRADHDLVLYVANWPAVRRYAWSSLLVARAVENQVCAVGVNRVGADANGHAYTGDSVALDALGKPLLALEPGQEAVATATFSGAELLAFRERFPAHLDQDDFTLGL